MGKRKKPMPQELLPTDSKTIIAKPVTVWDSPKWKAARPYLFTISFAGCFGLVLWGINQFLSLRGVIHVVASRIVLGLTVVAAILAALIITRALRARNLWFYLSACVIVVLALLLDWWAPKPQPNISVLVSGPQQRTYLIIDAIRFPSKLDGVGRKLPNSNFQAGDRIEFNYYTRVVGSNPLESHGTRRAIEIAPEATDTTQDEVIQTFEQQPYAHPEIIPKKMMPTEQDFDTVHGWNLDQSTIDAIHHGKKVVFVLIDIGYMDLGQLHHAKVCAYLQPPGFAPGVWHKCHKDFDQD